MLSCTFLEGGTRIFAREMDGETFFKMIEKYKITAAFTAPIFTYKLTSVPNPERFDTSSFRCFITGGTPMSTEQYKKLAVVFPQAQILFGYGMSECGIISAFHSTRDVYFIKNRIGSSGKVLAETTVKVCFYKIVFREIIINF